MTNYRSKCHNAPVSVISGGEGTSYYRCGTCHKECNFYDANNPPKSMTNTTCPTCGNNPSAICYDEWHLNQPDQCKQPDDQSKLNVNKAEFDMENVALCKSCGTAKHVNGDGLCGRCAPAREAEHVYPDANDTDDIYEHIKNCILCGGKGLVAPQAKATPRVKPLS